MAAEPEAALAGRRVLELADERGAYCGKLLADMGADVIRIEPPGGDATRAIPPFWGDRPGPDSSLFFLYMNTSKRGIVLDLERSEGRERFCRLAATADLVVETLAPGALDALGLGYETLRRENPRLVLTSITGFGQSGPRRDWRATDLVASALGGALAVIGEPEDPPVRLAGEQTHIMASAFAAVGSLIAMRHSARTGQGQRVDISMQEVVASVSHICGVGKWLDDGIVPRRRGTSLFASVPSGSYRCRDGLVYLMVNRPLHWKALAAWIHEVTGNREVLDPMFEGPSSNRQAHRELLDLFISELTGRFAVDEVYREGQARHIAFTPVNAAAAVAQDVQLESRGYFVPVVQSGGGVLRQPGAPYRHAVTPWRIARPAPSVGEHDAEVFGEERALPARPSAASAARPLEDLRVLEFTAGMAGPWIGRLMAWCGADVIRVESKRRPDVVRLYVPPWAPELGTQPRMSPWFTDWDAGKRFVALDLTRPEAVELARRLAARCDVVVENQSAGVMEKLGLGYAALRALKPDLILLSSSGYGDSGPHRRYVTWGSNIEALSGLATLSGFPERDGAITQFAYPDPLSALHGLVAVLCALEHRERTGRGQYVNLSQLESTVSAIGPLLLEVLANGREPRRLGNRSLRHAPHGCYPCRGEDRWCAIAVTSEAEWQSLCRVVGHPEWSTDSRFENEGELDRRLAEWTRSRGDGEVMEALQAAGVPAGAVQTAEDLMRDPQLAARGFFEEIEHGVRGRVLATGIPLGLTGTPGRSGRAGAAVGQDNESVFGGLLGLSPDEIARYVAAGAIEPPDEEGPTRSTSTGAPRGEWPGEP